MVTYHKGDITLDTAECLVNTVNCKGVMGAGVALAFKTRFPEIMPAYQKACKDGVILPGTCHSFNLPDGRIWAAFASKDLWKNSSRYEWVSNGLEDLRVLIRLYGISSVAMPLPGCGNGHLDPSKIEPMVLQALRNVKDLRIYS